MAFIQDPRLRQRWNQISHTTEAVTENAAAEIWTFGHRYVNPCLASLAAAADSCTGICLGGDREERARRARERDRGARRSRARTQAPEYSFDFYDDWEEDLDFGDGFPGYDNDYEDGVVGGVGGSSSGGGGGGGLNWDRLLAGTGSGHRGRAHGVGGDVTVVDQPKRKRGMSYGTRGGVRRKVSGEEDPNVIPRTAPLGFLGRLPFKIVGSLRYKPSAANLKEHPTGVGTAQEYRASGGRGEENEPLLGTSDEGDTGRYSKGSPRQRPRSNTTLSGDTSSSYRSRGDLFPSDGEGDEDAVPLDDEFTMALERVDDRGSTKTRSSKGKRPADRERDKGLSRSVSRTTISSTNTRGSYRSESNPLSASREVGDGILEPSLEDLQREEEEAEREEHQEIERRRRAASRLAAERGLSQNDIPGTRETVEETKVSSFHDEGAPPEESMPKANGSILDDGEAARVEEPKPHTTAPPEPTPSQTDKTDAQPRKESTFVPARLPHFS